MLAGCAAGAPTAPAPGATAPGAPDAEVTGPPAPRPDGGLAPSAPMPGPVVRPDAGPATPGPMPAPTRDGGGPADLVTPTDAVTSGPSPSDELFDPARIPHFEIVLPPASMTALGTDPTTYVRGELRYGAEIVKDVGVRIKGEATKRTLREKAAFKLKFDEFVPDQTFRGLRRLTLNNLTEDATFLAERLAYHVFRALGIPAPRANNARVSVNGTLFGLYANIETEDKTFLRRWFASDAGNLYEEGQRDFVPGAETSFELETNETRNDRSDLTAFISALAGAGDGDPLVALDRQLDVPHFLRFTAVEAIVNQWDMYAYTRFYPNNFRLYRDPATQKFVFLPWGMDMALKDFRGRGEHIGVFAIAREYNNPVGRITGGLVFQRCMRNPACKTRYAGVLRETLAEVEKLNLAGLAEAALAQIRAHVVADPRKEITVAEFERMSALMLRIIRERPARIRAELGTVGAM